jgi:hypothetical protein
MCVLGYRHHPRIAGAQKQQASCASAKQTFSAQGADFLGATEGKIVRQSFFMLTIVHPFCVAASSALSRCPTFESRS